MIPRIAQDPDSARARTITGHVTPAQYMSLVDELHDRGIDPDVLITGLVLAWLGAVTGHGTRCHCPGCPANIRTVRRHG